jgi:RNA polymerase sigma factor (sigma-70 family)
MLQSECKLPDPKCCNRGINRGGGRYCKFGRSADDVTQTGDPVQLARFERALLPHLDAAYNLARWLSGSAEDADDVVQEACLRALAFFDGFHGEDGRSWLLAIVRNTSHDWLRKSRRHAQFAAAVVDLDWAADAGPDPEEEQLRHADREAVQRGLEALPAEYREVVVLRELEGLSYKQIARVIDAPIGTVMSRLARARKRLMTLLAPAARRGEGT